MVVHHCVAKKPTNMPADVQRFSSRLKPRLSVVDSRYLEHLEAHVELRRKRAEIDASLAVQKHSTSQRARIRQKDAARHKRTRGRFEAFATYICAALSRHPPDIAMPMQHPPSPPPPPHFPPRQQGIAAVKSNNMSHAKATLSSPNVQPKQFFLLDVAGGRGHLAYELAVNRGVPTTVVDSVPVKLSAFKSKLLLSECTRLLRERRQRQQQQQKMGAMSSTAGEGGLLRASKRPLIADQSHQIPSHMYISIHVYTNAALRPTEGRCNVR